MISEKAICGIVSLPNFVSPPKIIRLSALIQWAMVLWIYTIYSICGCVRVMQTQTKRISMLFCEKRILSVFSWRKFFGAKHTTTEMILIPIYKFACVTLHPEFITMWSMNRKFRKWFFAPYRNGTHSWKAAKHLIGKRMFSSVHVCFMLQLHNNHKLNRLGEITRCQNVCGFESHFNMILWWNRCACVCK